MKTRGLSVRYVFDPAPHEQAFHFNDRSRAASLAEFQERLAHLPAETLRFHQDHFAAWVRGVVGDEPLALRIESYAQTRPDPETLRDILRDLVGKRLEDWREAASGTDASPS